ncbi:MAG: glycosyltransferase [Ignavibacteriaceae bacterium]|nr:glycosyltransferase [Ignavibacteriaceae bacterium]
MKEIKYSIIIPTLNEEKLIERLLSSLVDFRRDAGFDFELIISDGGSTDKTLDIAIMYADILKINSKGIKQTIAAGRNNGARIASGDILIFLNADIIIPDIKSFFTFLNEEFYPSDSIALTCFVKISPGEETTLDKLYHFGYNNYFRLLNLVGVGMGRGECQVIRRSYFEKVNGYNRELAAGEDFDLFRRLRKLGKIIFTNRIFVYESPRRFRKLGYANVTWSWIKNGFSVFLRKKAISSVWEEVR